MNLNALQKYLLKIYVIVILFFTFCVPTFENGYLTYGFIFINGMVSEVAYLYLLFEFVGITLAALALLLVAKEDKKK